jgi:hypothetical protein
MVEPRIALRERTVLVIDEGFAEPAVWVDQLRHLFVVVTTASLAGASVAIDGQEVAAVVLVLAAGGGQRSRTLITALRRHRSLERTAVFVVCHEVSLLAAELVGLADVEVLDPHHAEYDLSLQVGAAASRMSSRPAPRRLSTMPHLGEFRSLMPPAVDPAQRLLARFAQDCGERGQRGLGLCDRLQARDTTPAERQRAADELRNLLNFIRSDAVVLQQAELSQLLGLAEQIVARLKTQRGQLLVPRGVVGLLSAVAELRSGPSQLAKFDAELHRSRLEIALGRTS